MIAFILFSLISFIILMVPLVVYLRCSFRMCTSKVCMKEKVVIVTGANGGIGFHIAKSLAKRGARVILACRNKTRGCASRDAIISDTGNNDVVFMHLDLSSLKSVRQFATNILQSEHQLHVLVNNAGVHGFPDLTEDGIIEEMQINYFSHFLLTLLLLPLLKKSAPSRIINISSNLHFGGRFNPKTINTRRFFEGPLNYYNSKFCILMFSVELSRRLVGTGVVVNAAHPGVIKTKIGSNGHFMTRFLLWCWRIMYNRTAEQGAQTIEYLAVAEECAHISGKYFVDCASSYMSWKAKNQIKAIELWKYSEKLVGYSNADCTSIKKVS